MSTSDVKASLGMKLRSPTGYTADAHHYVTAAQWADINAVIEGAKTAKENALCDTVYDLRTMLQELVDLHADGPSLSLDLATEAAVKYLKENP